jgi:hypothetical protein
MSTNSVESILAGAKRTLAKANQFTHSVTGNATDYFAPKPPQKPNIPQTHKDAPYSLASEARDAGAGLKSKSDNVNQYIEAPKN